MRTRKHIFLILLVIAALVVIYVVMPQVASLGSKKHVLLITIDTTRADHLGCYGYDKNTSPNLDALAAESVQFDFAIAQAAVTPVSHA